MYRRIFLAKDGVTRLRQSIEYGPPPAVGDVIGLKVGRRKVSGTVTRVQPLKDSKISHEVEIVERPFR